MATTNRRKLRKLVADNGKPTHPAFRAGQSFGTSFLDTVALLGKESGTQFLCGMVGSWQAVVGKQPSRGAKRKGA